MQLIMQTNTTNKVQQFIKERCDRISTSKIKFKILYDYYINYEKENKCKPYSKKKTWQVME